jgi:ABC-type Mn2+/Zn2+ transport system ATPase subunit
VRAQLDENLPPALAKALHCLAEQEGHAVLHVTHDHHHRRAIERDAIARQGLVVFVLSKGWASQSYYEKAARLIQWWPRLVEHTEAMKPPAIFRVPWGPAARGKFEQIRIAR